MNVKENQMLAHVLQKLTGDNFTIQITEQSMDEGYHIDLISTKACPRLSNAQEIIETFKKNILSIALIQEDIKEKNQTIATLETQNLALNRYKTFYDMYKDLHRSEK